MFFGESTHSIDDKGRVFVPKRFLEELTRGAEGSFVAYLTRGQDACLSLFSDAGFQRAVAELSTGVFSGADARGVMRAYFANTARVELDASGRVLIPEKLRAAAGLEKDVVIVGLGDRAEIWARKTWTPYEAEHLAKLDDIDRVIAGERTKEVIPAAKQPDPDASQPKSPNPRHADPKHAGSRHASAKPERSGGRS